MGWEIKISKEAKKDIQEAVSWYNSKQKGLGRRFHKEVLHTFESIKKNPHFSIRYGEVRCLKIHKFPYLIHFFLDEANETIIIPGILHTSLNPDDKWFTDLEK